MKICPVILCGGIGTRLWPASQETLPKQFLKLNSEHSLFQNTILRVKNSNLFSNPLIICNNKYKFRIASELEALNISPLSIIVEPEQKNTAPAITVASFYLKKHHPELQKMLILSSDHLIENSDKFLKYIQNLNQIDTKDLLVTFGITPSNPAIGYGYIKQGEKINNLLFNIDKFIEKPSYYIAKQLISEKNNLWNSGMFFFDYETLLKEIKLYKPKIYELSQNIVDQTKEDNCFFNISAKSDFSKYENISIDYAILENTTNAAVMPVNITWNDLGTWKSIYDTIEKNSDNNVILGNRIHTDNTENCLIYSNNNQITTVAHRVKDLNIAVTDNVVLISDNQHPEEIKSLYNKLKDKKDISEAILEYRPWGYYRNILITNNYKVKLLSINPNSQISLQYHLKRAEHWVVTKGVASITIGNTVHTLNRDQSIYVPKNEIHKIENKASHPLEIIEVQIGDYLGEDDIVRLEDKYNRI